MAAPAATVSLTLTPTVTDDGAQATPQVAAAQAQHAAKHAPAPATRRAGDPQAAAGGRRAPKDAPAPAAATAPAGARPARAPTSPRRGDRRRPPSRTPASTRCRAP